MFSKKLNDYDLLTGLILFAKNEKIPHFKYKDFEFILSAPNPNADELNALKDEVAKLKVIVNQLTFKENMATPNIFNRGELLAQRLAGNK